MTADDLDDLRARRRRLQSLDDVVSYVRRVAQARGDLARAELARRARRATDDVPAAAQPAADPAADSAADERNAELPGVLADRLLGGEPRPPRPVEEHSEHPLAGELDELCAQHGFGRLDELSEPEIESLVAALDDFERDVSARRQAIFAELDGLTEEFVERLHDEHGPADGDGADPPEGGSGTDHR